MKICLRELVLQVVAKRIFDIIVSLIGLLIIWPLFVIIAVLIKLKMPGPVFFTQTRIGRYAEPFVIIKFRTMEVNHSNSSISVRGESRITPLGAKLRKYKLDELPELINVLKGDMSFVGPRPDVPGYADNLKGNDRKILELRPGITSPASLKYFNEEELLENQSDPKKFNDEVLFRDKVRLNLLYYERQSFLLDLKIIICTIFGSSLKFE